MGFDSSAANHTTTSGMSSDDRQVRSAEPDVIDRDAPATEREERGVAEIRDEPRDVPLQSFRLSNVQSQPNRMEI